MQDLKIRLISLLAGAWQFRWWGLAAAWLTCILGWAAIALIPNSYDSTAQVYIDTDTLMRPLLHGIAVSTNTQQEINVMLHTLLTSPNLERVVRVTNPKASSFSQAKMQDAVAEMASNVTLSRSGTHNLYSISYTSDDPQHAQSVAQALLSVMEDSNAGDHRRDSNDAISFIDSQIAQYEQKIETAEKRKTDFKLAHPEVFLDGSDIDTAETAVVTARNDVGDKRARVADLEAQISSTPKTIDINGPAPISIGGAGTLADKRQQLGQARAALDQLRAHYTDDYPDVIAQKKLIKRLETEISKKTNPDEDPDLQSVANPAYLMLRTKLADEDVSLAVAREKLTEAKKQLSNAQQDAGDALEVRRQYADLDRDATALRKDYQALVQRRESANISQAASEQQSSMVFRVVDPPSLPTRPSAPNRIVLNVLVLAAGFGVGAGAALGVSRLSDRILTAGDLRDAFAVPVLGSVTIARNAQDVLRHRRAVSLFAAGTGLLVAGYLMVLLVFHTAIITTGGKLL